MKCTNAIHRPGYFTLQLLHLSVIENILYKEVLCTGLFHLCIIMIMWNLGTESNKGCFMRNSDFVIEIWRRRKSRHCTWSLVYCFPFPFGAMKPNIAWHPLVSPQIRVGWQIFEEFFSHGPVSEIALLWRLLALMSTQHAFTKTYNGGQDLTKGLFDQPMQ